MIILLCISFQFLILVVWFQARPIKPIITASGLVHAPLSIPAPPVPREASASSISVQNGKSPSSSESSPLHVVIDPPRSGASPVSVCRMKTTLDHLVVTHLQQQA